MARRYQFDAILPYNRFNHLEEGWKVPTEKLLWVGLSLPARGLFRWSVRAWVVLSRKSRRSRWHSSHLERSFTVCSMAFSLRKSCFPAGLLVAGLCRNWKANFYCMYVYAYAYASHFMVSEFYPWEMNRQNRKREVMSTQVFRRAISLEESGWEKLSQANRFCLAMFWKLTKPFGSNITKFYVWKHFSLAWSRCAFWWLIRSPPYTIISRP